MCINGQCAIARVMKFGAKTSSPLALCLSLSFDNSLRSSDSTDCMPMQDAPGAHAPTAQNVTAPIDENQWSLIINHQVMIKVIPPITSNPQCLGDTGNAAGRGRHMGAFVGSAPPL